MKCSTSSTIHVNANDVVVQFAPAAFACRQPATQLSINQATWQSEKITMSCIITIPLTKNKLNSRPYICGEGSIIIT